MEKTKSFALIIAVLALSLGAVYLALGFTEPSVAPPAGNVPAPLNVGSSGQSKSGGLILNTGGAAYGLIVDKGNVGIGTPSPTVKLEVAGQVKITGGAPGTGKVLTSDASGLASWQTAAAGNVPAEILITSNDNEYTTNSGSPVDLVTLSGFSINPSKAIRMIFNTRGTGFTNAGGMVGLKVNGSWVIHNNYVICRVSDNGNYNHVIQVLIGPRFPNYQAVANMILVGKAGAGWQVIAGCNADATSYAAPTPEGVLPLDNITNITLTGMVYNPSSERVYIRGIRLYAEP